MKAVHRQSRDCDDARAAHASTFRLQRQFGLARANKQDLVEQLVAMGPNLPVVQPAAFGDRLAVQPLDVGGAALFPRRANTTAGDSSRGGLQHGRHVRIVQAVAISVH